jgi:hypothetical protein
VPSPAFYYAISSLTPTTLAQETTYDTNYSLEYCYPLLSMIATNP